MAGLSTHALDLVFGGAAANLRIDFLRQSNGGFGAVKTLTTNADGRTDELFLTRSEMAIGKFQLVFHVGAYFRARGAVEGERPFFDKVPVRFSIADPALHYHVPLLIAPWGYTAYRGS